MRCSNGCPDDQSAQEQRLQGCVVPEEQLAELWRLSAEQWGTAVKDLLSLPAAPALTARGGEATFAFFSDEYMTVGRKHNGRVQLLGNSKQYNVREIDTLNSRTSISLACCASVDPPVTPVNWRNAL